MGFKKEIFFVICLCLYLCFAENKKKLYGIGDVVKNSKNRDLILQWYNNDQLDPKARQTVESYMKKNSKSTDKKAEKKTYVKPFKKGDCHLHPLDISLYEKIMEFKKENAVLLEFKFNFPDYENNTDPLSTKGTNLTYVYESNKWSRVLSKHGRILLSLSFHYGLLSMSLLRLGVHRMNIDLQETEKYCLMAYTVEERLTFLRKLILDDFKVYEITEDVWHSKEDAACFRFARNDSGYASFEYSCCTRTIHDRQEICRTLEAENWILIINRLLYAVKIALLFFGPLMLQQWVYSDSIRKTDYIIRLPERLYKTILLRRVKMKDRSSSTDPNDMDEKQQFHIFRKLLKTLPPDRVVPISFKKLHLLVDHKKLMSEQSIPVGLFHTFYENLFRCQYRFVHPFYTCCEESIFGSWYPRFLWFKLGSKSQCNQSCRQYLSWGHVARVIGSLLLLTAISTPYILRVVIYYKYEEDEVDRRDRVRKELNLKKALEGSVLQYLTPNHPILVGLYVIYCISLLLLAFFRACDSEKFDNIARGSVQDLRCISRIHCFRLILAHILLPIEKFGIFFGIIVGCLYWPIVLPVCVFITLLYCVPLFYMTGRFLIHTRPKFLRTKPLSSPRRSYKRGLLPPSISDSVTSFESALLLDNISPQENRNEDTSIPGAMRSKSLTSTVVSTTVATCCIVVMYCIMLMFAECVGFLIEIFVFSIFGTVLNVGRAAVYICLFFWALLYTVRCYNSVYDKYMNLNKALFKMITEKLKISTRETAQLRESGMNTAVKYYSPLELHQNHLHELQLQREDYASDKVESSRLLIEPDKLCDSIEYRDDKLHWKMLNMVLFVDHKDRPRIPKELFETVCQIEAPGCPGPVYQSLVLATRHLLYMLTFLAFIGSIIWGVGRVYDIPPLLHLCAILAAGFIPLIVRYVLRSRDRDRESVHQYTLEGKVQQIIRNFYQVWPVYDLSFRVVPEDEEDTLPKQMADDFSNPDTPIERLTSTDPTHVDLLISIRDDGLETSQGSESASPETPNNAITSEAGRSLMSEQSSVSEKQTVDVIVDLNKGGSPIVRQSLSESPPSNGGLRYQTPRSCSGLGLSDDDQTSSV